MPANNNIVIKVESDNASLDSTVDKLTKIGVVDEKNANQFKKNNAALQSDINNTGKIQDKLTDKIVDQGKKAQKAHESHLSSVLKLGKGFAGVAGLLDIFGKALGLNEEQLKILQGTHSALIASSRDLHHITELGTESTEANTVSKEANVAITEEATVAQNAQTVAIEETNAAFLETPIGMIVALGAALAVVGAAIYELSKDEEESIEGITLTTQAFADQQKVINKLHETIFSKMVDYKVLTGEYTKVGGEIVKINYATNVELSKNQQEYEKKVKELREINNIDEKGKSKAWNETTKLQQEKIYHEELKRIQKYFGDKRDALKQENNTDRALIQQQEITRLADEDDGRNKRKKKETDYEDVLRHLRNDNIEDEYAQKKAKIEEEFNDESKKYAGHTQILVELKKKRDQELKAVDEEMLKDAEAAADKAEAEDVAKANKETAKRKAEMLKNEDEFGKNLQIETLKRYNAGLIDQKQFNKETLQNDIKLQEDIQKDYEAGDKEYIDAEKKKQEDLKALRDQESKDLKSSVQKTIDETKQIVDYAISAAEAVIEGNISAIDHQEQLQRDSIAKQQQLAAAGKENTLAFEERKQSDLEKQRVQQEKKLVKMKELEVFLNAMASFSKDDPKSALAKALAEVALMKGVEASFAEQGGIIGQTTSKSMIGFGGMSKRHRSGNDVLLHAERGEGILSVKEMNNLGVGNFNMFKSMLQQPLTEKLIPGKSNGPGNAEVISKLEELGQIILNKKETHVDWESHDNMNARNIVEIERGITTLTKNILKKPRI